jgi:hypothetical protein
MGEYAKVKGTGESVKIGTCESMYYLRADQVRQVWHEHGNVDPARDTASLLYRFPFPREDGESPGGFDSAWPSFRLHVPIPDIEHGLTQFTAGNGNGYLVSLPCPESAPVTQPGARVLENGLRIGLNGYGGSVNLVAQRVLGDRLVAVGECRGCGRLFRWPTIEDVQPVLDELERKAEEQQRTAERNNTPGNADVAREYVEIARRIVAGYMPGAATDLGLAPWEPAEVDA